MGSSSVAGALARARFDGTLVDPGHAQYEQLRRVYNNVIDRRPSAILQAASASDVQALVRIAAEGELPIAVRCGGHSFAGLGTCDRGIVCDLSRMNNVLVDPRARIAEVSGGALLGHVDAAGLKHDLVTPAGVVSHTGVGGLTLGGGMGYLSRRFGLTIDSLIGVDIITAEGQLLHVGENEHPDLFWAIRGGGGNFGIVTKFRFRMHALGTTLIRQWIYPIAEVADVLTRYADALGDVPRELTTAFVLSPDGFSLTAIWSGSAAGAPIVERFGRLGSGVPGPSWDTSFLALQSRSDESLRWGRRYYSKGGFLETLDVPAITVMTEAIGSMPVPGVEVYGLQLGGAVCDVDEQATAYAGRAAGLYWISQGVWDDPGDDEKAIAWCRATAGQLVPLSMNANYVNEQADTGVARSAYGAQKYARLAELKWRYDPTNLFRLNQNIEPRAP